MQVLSPAHTAFGAEVRDRRHELSLTQEDLSDRAGVHVSYVSQVERGLKNISLSNLLKFSKALECSASRLVTAAEDASAG